MPSLLVYPKIPIIEERPEAIGVFSYIIHDYEPGITILAKSQDDDIGFTIGDWDSNILTPDSDTDSKIKAILGDHCPKISRWMYNIKLKQAQYYFAADGSLVDVQLSLNNFLLPAMLRDLFKATFTTQRLIESAVLTPEKIVEIKSDKSKYPAKVIVKPNRKRFVGHPPAPCYARIT